MFLLWTVKDTMLKLRSENRPWVVALFLIPIIKAQPTSTHPEREVKQRMRGISCGLALLSLAVIPACLLSLLPGATAEPSVGKHGACPFSLASHGQYII